MKALILCAALAAAPAFADDLIARQGEDSVRLGDAPCTSEQVLVRLQPQTHEDFRAATAVFQGRSFVACWRPVGSMAVLIYEDGDQGIIPLADLRRALVS